MSSVTLLLPPWSAGFSKKLEVKKDKPRARTSCWPLLLSPCQCGHAMLFIVDPGDTGVDDGSQSRDVQKGFREGSLSMNSGEFQEVSRRAGVAGTARLPCRWLVRNPCHLVGMDLILFTEYLQSVILHSFIQHILRKHGSSWTTRSSQRNLL